MLTSLGINGWPIGTPYAVTVPAYCIADEEFPAYVYTRRALACDWTAPAPRVQGPEPAADPALNLFEQMFGIDA